MRNSVVSIGLLLVFILSLFTIGGTNTVVERGASEETPRSGYVESQYTPHEPIIITSNQDFAGQGWPGKGNPKTPYLIQGLSITSDETCINISSTTAHFEISDCYFTYSSEEGHGMGVFLDSAQNGFIENCTFVGLDNGVWLTGSDNHIIAFNELDVTGYASINLYQSDYCQVYNNSVEEAGSFGILVDRSVDVFLANNSLHNELYGMNIDRSVDCVVVDNEFEKSGLYVFGTEIDHFVSNTFENNVVGGRPIVVLTDRTSEVIDASACGQLFLFNSDDCIVENGTFDYRNVGVLLAFCSDCVVKDLSSVYNMRCMVELHACSNTIVTRCDVAESYNAGFRFRDTVNCTLTGCSSGNPPNGHGGIDLFVTENTTISHNVFQVGGVVGYSSTDCSIMDNEFEGSTSVQEYGIRFLGAHNVNVSGNELHGLYTGVFFEATATNVTIFNNTIHDNQYHGINLDETCEGFRIYNNSFWYNSVGNAIDDGMWNYWDDGVSVGNLWDDYSGTGVYNIPGSAGSVDHFPGVYQTPTTTTTTTTTQTTGSTTGTTTQLTSPTGDGLMLYAILGVGVVGVAVVVIVIILRKRA